MQAYSYERTAWVTGETPLSAENMNNIEDWIAYVDGHLLDLVYPVGAIYLSVNEVEPSALLGGTWERICDRFLLAAGENYAPGDLGGLESVVLTETQLPAHSHLMRHTLAANEAQGYGLTLSMPFQDRVIMDTDSKEGFVPTEMTGSGEAHSNMPPYLAVYAWKRTA